MSKSSLQDTADAPITIPLCAVLFTQSCSEKEGRERSETSFGHRMALLMIFIPCEVLAVTEGKEDMSSFTSVKKLLDVHLQFAEWSCTSNGAHLKQGPHRS